MAEHTTSARSFGGSRGPRRALLLRAILIAAPVILALSVASLIAWRMISHQHASDMLSWQNRLAIIAESRTERINAWLDEHFAVVEGIAADDPIALYVSNLLQKAERQDEVALIQRRYLENFLTVSATQGGFMARQSAKQIDANVPSISEAGLLIASADGRILARTVDSPALDSDWRKFLASPGEPRRLRGIYRGPSGVPSVAFVVPIRHPELKATGPVFVIGVKPVDDTFFSLLRQPGNLHKSLEAYLVRRAGRSIEYLSPLRDGTPALGLTQDADTPDLAASFAARSPGAFAINLDYKGERVLTTGRAIFDGQWVLVQTIGRDEALSESDSRLARNLIIVALGVLLISGSIILIWKQAVSRRLQAALERNHAITSRLLAEERLLRSVTDSVSDNILITDETGKVKFANHAVARRLEMPGEMLPEKSIRNLMGPAAAAQYINLLETVSRSGRRDSAEWRSLDAPSRIIRTTVIPVGAAIGTEVRYLIVDTDITDSVTERERQMRLLSRLIDGMVAMADHRDPRAQGQSREVADLALAIGQEIGLSPDQLTELEMTARLVNFYKILVPTDILTQEHALRAGDYEKIDQAKRESIDFLSNIPEMAGARRALAELDERYDGSGKPAGLKGEAICMTAQVIALANAFVAMTRERAYRARLSTDAAIRQIEASSGGQYAPRVVAAFLNYMENRGGRQQRPTQ